jgi:hypothetical protein
MINENPAPLALTRQIKGKTACVVYVDQTKSIYFPSSSKMVYIWHRRFLPPKHRHHQWRSWFHSTIENEEAPKHRDGKFVFGMIKNIKVIFEKPVKGIKRNKARSLQRTHHLRSSQFSSYTYPTRKSLRLAMSSIPCTLRRVSFKVPSVCCWASQVRQRTYLVPIRTFRLLK